MVLRLSGDIFTTEVKVSHSHPNIENFISIFETSRSSTGFLLAYQGMVQWYQDVSSEIKLALNVSKLSVTKATFGPRALRARTTDLAVDLGDG